MATVVAVFAHPDDETFICGGTLARLAEGGRRVVLVCATKGEAGRRMGVPAAANRETLPRLREQELRDACAALGIDELILLGYRDKTLEIQPLEELEETIFEVFQREQPELVITFHEDLGGHPDHCTMGKAAASAYQRYTAASTAHAACGLWFVAWSRTGNTLGKYGIQKEDFFHVDVTPAQFSKLAAFRAHRTQSELNEWLRQSDQEAMQSLASKEYFIRGAGDVRPQALNLWQENAK